MPALRPIILNEQLCQGSFALGRSEKLLLPLIGSQMPRLKRSPHNPLAEYQQREAGPFVVMEIENPLALLPDMGKLRATIEVIRQTRGDPLAALHARKFIDEASYHGGRAYQNDFETAERGPQAIDPSKEYVDGGKPPEPITDRQQAAVVRLARADLRLGVAGKSLIRGFLITGLTMEQLCQARGLLGMREKLYIGRRIRECLNDLAVIYGFATGGR